MARQQRVIDQWCKAVGVSEQDDDALQGDADVDADSESVVFEDVAENALPFESMTVSLSDSSTLRPCISRYTCDVLAGWKRARGSGGGSENAH